MSSSLLSQYKLRKTPHKLQSEPQQHLQPHNLLPRRVSALDSSHG